MGKRTALYDDHLAAGARIVDFGGWDMPLHYGSQIGEHRRVREDAGMFDVSHMTVVDVTGPDAEPFLRRLLANDVARLHDPGKALYSCMLNENAGVVDDLIVYFRGPERYRVVVNAATREKDLEWMHRHAQGFAVDLAEQTETAMIAVQGPHARQRVMDVMPGEHRAALEGLRPFFGVDAGAWFVARTGYTGEDGFEVMLPAGDAPEFWRALLEAGVAPAGLGARDTLRLEAGMNLYGADMDETVTPLESGLGWTVAWEPQDRRFVGREALAAQKAAGVRRKLVGLVLEGKGVLRTHQKVLVADEGEGEITSGTFSPTLGVAIALARVPVGTGAQVEVEIRGKRLPARVVKPVFVRQGESLI